MLAPVPAHRRGGNLACQRLLGGRFFTIPYLLVSWFVPKKKAACSEKHLFLCHFWLVVSSTHLKNMSQIGHLPPFSGWKFKKSLSCHLAFLFTTPTSCEQFTYRSLNIRFNFRGETSPIVVHLVFIYGKWSFIQRNQKRKVSHIQIHHKTPTCTGYQWYGPLCFAKQCNLKKYSCLPDKSCVTCPRKGKEHVCFSVFPMSITIYLNSPVRLENIHPKYFLSFLMEQS